MFIKLRIDAVLDCGCGSCCRAHMTLPLPPVTWLLGLPVTVVDDATDVVVATTAA